jgi:hypothetical protein
VTVGDLPGVGGGGASSLHTVDPEPDLDAIARDLAEVETELERLAGGPDAAPGEDEDEDPSPRPAAS